MISEELAMEHRLMFARYVAAILSTETAVAPKIDESVVKRAQDLCNITREQFRKNPSLYGR